MCPLHVLLIVGFAVAQGQSKHDQVCDAGVQRLSAHALLQHSSPTTNNTGPTPAQFVGSRERDRVHLKSTGDGKAFLTGACTNLMVCAACLVAFSLLRDTFSSVYCFNVKTEATTEKTSRLFSWVAGSWKAISNETVDAIGMDSALMVEFCAFVAKLMAAISIPMLLVFCPLHLLYGGGGAKDVMASLSIGNVRPGHSWLFHLHAVGVIWVSFATKSCVFSAQEEFMERRFRWLKNMPSPRANTVVVEGIPKEFRNEEKLRKFFSDRFWPGAVTELCLVKGAKALRELVAARDAAQAGKLEAELHLQKEGTRPTMRTSYFGQKVDSIDFYSQVVEEKSSLISVERARVKKDSANAVGGVNCSSAFVTFQSRRDVAMACSLRFSSNDFEWIITEAPEASSIRWQDFQLDMHEKHAKGILGYALVATLFICFSPICIAISDAAEAIDVGMFQPMWASLAPTLGLTVFLSFLPTVLLLICDWCFVLKTSSSAQLYLQVWYFWFLAFFVLFLPTLGTNFQGFAHDLSENPRSVLTLVADKLPASMPFFANFIVLQWSTACIELLRIANLSKFLAFRALYPESKAREMAEPEDQDYYGMGGRSARHTINVLVGCIFCSLSPLVAVLALVEVLLQRLVFGYLIVSAETKKPDTGGHFWVASLRQILLGKIFYSALMCGVLLRGSPSYLPPAVAFACLAYGIGSLVQFDRCFRWQALPFTEIADGADTWHATAAGSYEQPELLDR
eukprot:TRINITY_DN76262_c0_g1_i1.p1 TRINITY_DN76262_c0_g1~~TRINITY_DN76262_c0_g1_i1.p1  ORF type:complete len:738 (-),score=121.91 TRINITY_DN76262_c0_g1_i1:139-2352(-)